MTKLPPGLYLDIPAADYHGDLCERPALSASVAKILLETSLEHAYADHPALGGADEEGEGDEGDDTEVVRIGHLVHHLLLGGGSQYVRVMKRDAKTGEVDEAQDYRTKSAQEHREMIESQGKIPVLGKKYDTASKLCDKLRPKLVIPVQTEVTAVWEVGGVLCKGRFDGLDIANGRARIWDLKSCGNGRARRSASASSMLNYGYHIQRAAYIEALETIRPDLAGRVDFEFAFAEVGGVCGVYRCDLDAVMIELGRRLWNRAKVAWQYCLDSNTWPGYDDTKHIVEAPAWVLAQAGYDS
jgi:PDDEXK-like domain of unknown function (DUF3799)